MASSSMDLILGRVISALENEASLLGGVSEEIDLIKQELETVGAFLKDAEKKNGNLTEVEKTWVTQMKRIAYEVENIIDEFTYHINSQQVGGQFTRLLRKTLYFPKNSWARHQIATKLQKINKTLNAIPERNKRCGVERIEGSSSSQKDGNWQQNLGESCLLTNEDHLVGIESVRQLLKGWLMDGEAQLTSVSLVGMGGSGKSTIAAKTYNDEGLKQNFGCYAWITVSQTYVMDDLFKRLIKEFYRSTHEKIPLDLNSMAFKDLLYLLVNYLKPRRYLVVLDDIWDPEVLIKMTTVFQNWHLGSRIIITTRNEAVGSFSFGVPSRSHHIQPLSNEKSWTLFSKKAFSSCDDKSCPLEIETVARELVGRCKGLPLAIVALGGLMASKKTKEEWSRVLDNLSWQLNNNPMLEAVTKRILFLSFNDLPYHLKQCFLYCSIFPEDYCIERERIVRLWLAEGFVKQVNRINPEEVARSYLYELTSRSMLQVVKMDRDGEPIRCKMHDLMRELALSISETENFFALYDGRQTLENHENRRLSVQVSDDELKSYSHMSHLRSLLVFHYDWDATPSFSDMFPSGLKLLRVLDLEYVPINKVPCELSCLFNLKYLNLRNTPITKLPESIRRLHNLETLDIVGTQIKKLPSGITKCKNLRVLLAYRTTGNFGDFRSIDGTRVSADICKLKKLAIMRWIEVEGDIIKRVGNMTQLRNIGFTNLREEDGMNLCVSVQKLKLLLHLTLMAADEEAFLDIESLSSPPPLLKTLTLGGKLGKVPHWFSSLQSLTSLSLRWSGLTDDPLPQVGALPCLAKLVLINDYAGKSFSFLGGFVNLKRLTLRNFSQMTEIFIKKGVMPGLQVLYMGEMMELKTLPRGIEHLAKLEEFVLEKVSEELVDLIRGEGAVDRPKVKHIPMIKYYYQTANGMKFENLA